MRAYDAERERNRSAGRKVEIVISTYVPSKWRFVDAETGELWRWDQDAERFRLVGVAIRQAIDEGEADDRI